jgi:hypothetical protein
VHFDSAQAITRTAFGPESEAEVEAEGRSWRTLRATAPSQRRARRRVVAAARLSRKRPLPSAIERLRTMRQLRPYRARTSSAPGA